MKPNDPLSKLMTEAHVDPQLRAELLRNPEEVAKRHGVEMGAEEAARLRKLGAFTELVAEVKNGRIAGCDPRVCYPVTVWERGAFKDLVAELIPAKRPPVFYPIFYPAPDWGQSIRLDALRAFSAARFKGKIIPEEIFYPADIFGRFFEKMQLDLTRRLEVMLDERLGARR